MQLKCGVSVNKMVKASEETQDPAKQWIEIEHSTMHIKEYDSDHDLHKSEDEAEEQVTKKKTDEEKGKKNESCASTIEEAVTQKKQPEETTSGEASSNHKSKERRPSSREGDYDSEDDNDVVMVELDEDFVVERVSDGGGVNEVVSSQDVTAAEVVGEQSAPTHRSHSLLICFNCNRLVYYPNLH